MNYKYSLFLSTILSALNAQRQRWLSFIVILAIILFIIEISFRLNEASIISLQDKALIKLQMFKLREKTDFLLLGSSRSQDSFLPDVMTNKLSQIDPRWINFKAFNGGLSGASLQRLSYIAEQALEKNGLKVLALEVSDPQLRNIDWSPSFFASDKKINVEGWLQNNVSNTFFIVRYRKAFRVNILLRLTNLMLANQSNGVALFGRGILKRPFLKDRIEMLEEDKENWAISIIRPQNSVNERLTLIKGEENYLPVYEKIASKARSRGVKILLFVPPVTGKELERECDQQHLNTYQAIANITQSPLVLHSCKPLRMDFFYRRDEGHLNKVGRTIWSEKLAESLIESTLIDRENK